jgi:hypothetical protein
MTEKDMEKIDGMIARRIGVFAESIQHKLDLVVEGQQMLSEKVDRWRTELEDRIGCVEHKLDVVAAETRGNTDAIRRVEVKIDAVAADLSAHRADTEAHRRVYKVKED